MPYVEGESLRARLEREGTLPVEDTKTILAEVLDGLDHAHRKGIIHRDIKPDNILLTGRHAMIADFGVAKAVHVAGGSHTTAGMAVGTPHYMAPEQAVADPRTDHRADLYSAAALGYEMLTGRALFSDRSPQQAVAAHIMEAPPRLAGSRPEVPAALSDAIMRGLAKDPDTRWQTAMEFAGHLVIPAGPAVAPARPGRTPVLLAAAVVLGLATWGILRVVEGRTGSNPAAPVSVVAVMPFSVTGGDRFTYLQEGLVNLLAASLDGVGGIRSVNAHALLASSGGTVPDLVRARQLAAHFGAGRFVVGNVIEVGGTLRLSASLFAGNQEAPLAMVNEEGPDTALFQLVDRLGARLVAEATLGGDPRARLAAVTTASLPALRAYLEGERAYRAGQYLAAVSAFQDAIVGDTAFALAFYRLSMAQERLAWADASQRSAEQALRFADRLTPHQRRFLEAVVALRHGDTWKSEVMFRELVATHPDDAEAWYQLGEIEFHGNPLRGRSMVEAGEALRRALFYDPADLGAMYHLLRILARKQDPAELDSLAGVFFALTPSGDRTLELRALQAFSRGEPEARNAILAEVARAPDNSLPLIVWSVAVFARNIPGALQITALMRQPERPQDVRALGWLEQAHLELARGRLTAARTALIRAKELESPDAASAEAWMAALPFVPTSPEPTGTGAVPLPSGSRPSVFFSVHDSVHQVVSSYVRGLGAARQRDEAGLTGAVTALRSLSGQSTAGALAGELARGLEAQRETAGGRFQPALDLLESFLPAGWYERTFVSPFYAGALERFRRAELLQRAGRLEEALGWYNGLTENSIRELVFLGPSLLRQSEILEQLGRGPDAVPLLERLLELWSEADPDFAPMVAEARGRLARVRPGTTG